jgi:PEP-CTERM motif
MTCLRGMALVPRMIVAFTLVLATGSVAFSAPMVYTDEASWLAAVNALALANMTVVTEDFSTSTVGSTGVGTADVGQFSATVGGDVGLNRINGTGIINGTREFQGDVEGVATTTLSFGAFDIGPTIYGFAGTWNAATNAAGVKATINGVTFTFSAIGGFDDDNAFLGFVDSAGFSSIAFGAVDTSSIFGEIFNLDDVKIAAPVTTLAVPEPTSLLLLGTGLIGAGVRRYRQHRAKP